MIPNTFFVKSVKRAFAKRLLNLDKDEITRHLVIGKFIESPCFPYDEGKERKLLFQEFKS